MTDAIRSAARLVLDADPALLHIVVLSLAVSGAATLLASLVGLPLGAALAVVRFRGRGALVLAANALLGLPPVVVGLALYLLLSRAGPFGFLGFLFTPAAMTAAQSFLALPIVVALAHRAAEVAWRTHGDDLQVDGASPGRAVMTVLAIGRSGMLTATLAGFGRAISEVGAILLVGGNIAGHTRTMTTSDRSGDQPWRFRVRLGARGRARRLEPDRERRCVRPGRAARQTGPRKPRAGPRMSVPAMTRRRFIVAAVALLLCALTQVTSPARAQPFITVASTTSTEQSGLFAHLLPAFTKATGIEVRVVAVGTGQALKLGERGDADVVLVHDRAAELKFVADGWRVGRHDLMYNDFVIVGPTGDPARIAGGKDAMAAYRKIAEAGATFVTRGDDSGTNAAELRSWRDAGIDPKAASAGKGWYTDIGGGMGQALNTAAALGAYTLSDRGTWLSFRNRRDIVLLIEGDPRLFNQYGVMLVNPARHATVKAGLGQIFIDWLISQAGQATVASYRIDGQQLFFPDVDRPGL